MNTEITIKSNRANKKMFNVTYVIWGIRDLHIPFVF